jgi:hypothetical protein
LEFAIAGGVDGRKRGTGRDQALRVGEAFGGAEDFQELVAFAADATEEPGFLEDESPGKEREDEKQDQYEASNPAGLGENFEDVADETGGEQNDDVNPSVESKIW